MSLLEIDIVIYIIKAGKKIEEMILKNKIFNLKFYFIIIIIVLFYYNTFYAKSINISGVDVNITHEVVKENITVGKKATEENEEGKDYNKKEAKNKFVNIELVVRNNNPYEAANITIVEKVNSGFKQLGTNKVDRKISLKLECNKEKTFKYNYKYEKNFILDQFNKLIYGDNDSYEEVNNDNTLVIDDKNINDEDYGNIKNVSDDNNNKKSKSSNTFLVIIICIILGVIVIYGFRLFLRSLNDKDVDFDDLNKFNGFIIIIVLSLLISAIGKTNIYASSYEPMLYQKGQNFTKTITETVVFNERYFNFSYEITVKYENKHEITDYEKDTDGDLLSDALEYLYMTDINDKDSDGDGLNDYLEVMILNYNPNSKWTFNDGRNDGYRDYDGDGLRNKKEIEIGTDPTLYDTDGDNLSDYDEVEGIKSKDGNFTYQTSPLLKDTDEDLLDDDLEIKLGLDPTNRMTDGVTPDVERKIEQEYKLSQVPTILREGDIVIKKISGEVRGNIDSNIKITEYHSNSLDNVTALVSPTFNVSNENNNRIEITFDVTNVSDRIENLMVIKYIDGKLVPIDTDFEDNTISAKVDSGVYGIVDCDYILRDLNIFVSDYID